MKSQRFSMAGVPFLVRLKSGQSIGWLLLVFLTPLLFNLWGQQPFELPKVMWVRTLIWMLAGFALAQYILGSRSFRGWPQSSPILAPVALLALVIVVTTATAVNWRLSLWGSYERNQGAVTLLTYLLLFLLAINHFQSQAKARPVITVMAITGIPLILISTAQQLGWQPLNLISDARSPLYATLGRANFLGAYLAILVPLTLFLLLTTRSRTKRLFWSALLCGNIVIIGLTGARSAWLATAVSLALFALLWWGKHLSARWQILAWIGTGLLMVSGSLAVWLWGQNQIGSLAARRTIWQGTLALIKERPLLGYGADALGVVFPSVYPPELVYYQGREFFVDRAHHLFLDWLIIAGIPGLLAFLLILVMFVILFIRAWRQPLLPVKRALLAAILAAVGGMITNNLTSFDVTPTATAFWLLLGMGAALCQPVEIAIGRNIGKRPFWQWSLVSLLFIGIGLIVWQGNIRPLHADMAARSTQKYVQIGDWTNAVAAAERAVSAWPSEPAHHLRLSQAYWQQASADPENASNWLAQAETALRTAQQLRPEDPALWLQTAQFYASAAEQFGSDTLPLADAAYQQAVTYAPNQATLYTAWANFYLQTGDPKTAATLLETAVALDASNGEVYLQLGAVELSQHNLEAALHNYREAVRLLPESSQAYSGLAHCYWQLGQPQKAFWAATEALQRNPHNPQAIAIHNASEIEQ